MTRRRPLIAGNWKMNGLKASLGEVAALRQAAEAGDLDRVDMVVCPPYTLLVPMADALAGTAIAVGGQDCEPQASGAHTGDIAAEMIADAGGRYVILGHSERRHFHGDDDAVVHLKAGAAARAGLTAIICVGETRKQRDAGDALAVIAAQVEGSLPSDPSAERIVFAYEPVWAVGSGLTPTPADIAAAHGAIRRCLETLLPTGAETVRIIYGGSVKGSNVGEIARASDVDGVLVGGASLKAADFLPIAAGFR